MIALNLTEKRLVLLYSFLCMSYTCLKAQTDEDKKDRLSPKEFTIPAAPVFDLMGVTPSSINQTSDIKDFKVDWSFKSWKLNPNLAIQSQPVWEIFYNRKDLSKYQAASSFARRMASLDLSVGTIQDEAGDRRIGFASKISLYRQKDPLMELELYKDISTQFEEEKTSLEAQLSALQDQLDTSASILEKPALRTQMQAVEQELYSINSRRNAEINTRKAIVAAENWNAASLDLAFGKIYTYQIDSSGSLGNLKLNRNTGLGLWLNGGLGLGKKILLTGLIRTTWYEEQLDFLIQETASGNEVTQTAVASTNLYSGGLNIRYGGPLYNFFMEIFYEKKSIKTAADALGKVFTPDAGFNVIDQSVNWDIVLPTTLSMGGDWRISRNVIINYGMRFSFDQNWTFKKFTPVASIACMMR